MIRRQVHYERPTTDRSRGEAALVGIGNARSLTLRADLAEHGALSAIAEAGHCRLVSRNGHGIAARRSVTRNSLVSLLRSLWPGLVLLLLFFLFLFRHLLLLVFFLVFLAALVSHDFSFLPL